MESNLKENVGDIKMCTEFTMLEVKVPIVFFRHVGFSGTQGQTLKFNPTPSKIIPLYLDDSS
jgi:hypothetical protein